jgi:D-glycero-D-manno-heptose 1,7-bisphosphate phosphatase
MLEHVGIFFDRDGTINTQIDFLRHPDELELIRKAAQAIREANSLGLRFFVITNQSGIARGLMSETDLAAVHERLRDLLGNQGARIDAIYYCPHHPEFGKPPYNIFCDCRKPDIGMLTRAALSFLVGDRAADMVAGKKAGCTTILVLTGYGKTEEPECVAARNVDHISEDAYGAWLTIKSTLNHTPSHSVAS